MGLEFADLGGKGLTMVRHAIGIDLGGTSVKYAVVASSGEVLFNGQLPALAQESAEAVLGQILKGVEACREYAAGGGLTLAGVGIGTPGVVSADGRTVLGGAENIAGWENVPLADRIEQAAGLKTLAGNDANMMALGAGVTGPNLAKRMLELFLNTEFEGGRHARRVALLDAIR